MIVVLGDEVKVIHQTHGLFKPWVQNGAAKERPVDFCNSVHKLRSSVPKFQQNVLDLTRVVIGLVRFSIAQIRGGELIGSGQIVLHPCHP